MKVAYLDCPTGIAGDMFLGALVDAGVPLEYLQKKLQGLGIEQEYSLHAEKVHRQGQIATKVAVHIHSHHSLESPAHAHSRHLPEIQTLIEKANLPPQACSWSLAVFEQLAQAEGAVHGISPQEVHFHEVGATDAIVDIVGTCLGLDYLGVEEIHCSPFPTGGGTVKSAHGQLPVPVPAVLKLWEMFTVPVYSNGINKELVTPTGAALACTLASRFGEPPQMQLHRIGLGAGTSELSLPNIFRLWLGECSASMGDIETVAVLETQIDDTTPQVIAYTLETLLTAGALDVFTQGINMKKSRLGTLITVICPPDKVKDCEEILFQETTTLGIRHSRQQRSILQREIETVTTEYGEVRVKVASQGDNIINVQPEYEDCAKIARQSGQPLQQIQRLVMELWRKGSRAKSA